MIDMLRKDILPALTRYENELLSVICEKKEAGFCSEESYETTVCKVIDDRKKKICADIKEIERLLSSNSSSSAQEKAFFYHDKILPLMEEMRNDTDELEKICDRSCWPMPTYYELLFGVE